MNIEKNIYCMFWETILTATVYKDYHASEPWFCHGASKSDTSDQNRHHHSQTVSEIIYWYTLFSSFQIIRVKFSCAHISLMFIEVLSKLYAIWHKAYYSNHIKCDPLSNWISYNHVDTNGFYYTFWKIHIYKYSNWKFPSILQEMPGPPLPRTPLDQ